MIKIFVQYGIFTLVGYAILYLFSFVLEKGINEVDNMIVPCQHGTSFIQGKCRCDGTPFNGTYCSTCTCEHGFCSTDPTTPFFSSDYGCRCPSLGKRFGFLCDLCNTIIQENCTGSCKPDFFGLRCEKICYADLIHENNNSVCNIMRKSGGHCSTCHGHGTCEMGECKCDKNWFNDGSLECIQTCPGNPICSGHGNCELYGNTPGCLCEDGWNGVNCDIPCPGVIETGNKCNDNGICNVDYDSETTTCECLDKFRGEACEIECPGDIVPCNGHGTCDDLGVCTCDTNVKWSLPSCKCSDELTCNLNGECNEEEKCVCFGNSGGDRCLECEDNWHGNKCDLYCNPYLKNNNNYHEDGGFGCYGHGTCLVEEDSVSCTCNLDTTNRLVKDGAVHDYVSYYDTETNCAECLQEYFPKQHIFDEYGVPEGYTVPCENVCEPSTCNHHGVCNPNFGTPGETLCSCLSLHLSDVSFCTECDEHWYPLDLNSNVTCSKFCIDSGELPEECDGTIDCVQCNGHGTCTEEGNCLCEGSYTGDKCQILCEGQNGLICGGHGTCESNEIQLLMEHEFAADNVPMFSCTCDPQDPVDADSRIDWDEKLAAGLVNGTLDPPPNPEYFGETCDYSCVKPPWDDPDECNGMGNCTQIYIRTQSDQTVSCTTDADCQDSIIIQQIISGDATWSDKKGPFCHKLDVHHNCNKSTDDCYEILLKQRPRKMRSEECVSNTGCHTAIETEDWYDYCTNVYQEMQPEEFKYCKSVASFCPVQYISPQCKTMVNLTDGKDVSYKINFIYEYDKKHYPFKITDEYRSNESVTEHDDAYVAFSTFNHMVDLRLSDNFCEDFTHRYPIISTVRENKQYLCNGVISDNKNCSGTLGESLGIFYKPFTVVCDNANESFSSYQEAMMNRPSNCKIHEQEKDQVFITSSGVEHIDTMCNEINSKFPSCTYPKACDFNPCSSEEYTCENKGTKAICSTTENLNSTCKKGISERLSYSSYSCDITIPYTSCPNIITHTEDLSAHCLRYNPITDSVINIGNNESSTLLLGNYIHFQFKATDVITIGTRLEFGDSIRIYIRQGQIQLNEAETLQSCPITDQGCNNLWEYYSDIWYHIELKVNTTHVTMKRKDTGISITKALLTTSDIDKVTTVPGSSIVEYKNIYTENDIPSPFVCDYETCDLDVSYREICSDIIRNVEYPSLLEPKHDPLTVCSNYFQKTRVPANEEYNVMEDIYKMDWTIYCDFYTDLTNDKMYEEILFEQLEEYSTCQKFVDVLDGNKTCIDNALDYDWDTSCLELLQVQIPDTIKNVCPQQCYNHLLNYTDCDDTLEIFSSNKVVIDSSECSVDWYDYCLNDSKGTLEGKCAAVECSCNYETNEGISGESCELHCPLASDGTACAEGSNLGKCVYTEHQKQKIERGEKFKPIWAIEGECQCFMSEGTRSCDIECFQCNNDTYNGGQIGICDNTRGVCDCLPPFTEIFSYTEENWRGKNTTKIEKIYNTGNNTGKDLFRIRMMQGKESFVKHALEVSQGVSAYDGIQDWKTLFYDFIDNPQNYWCFDKPCDAEHTTLASNLDHSSSRYNYDCNSICPGTNETTMIPCSGHGECGVNGQCVCDPAKIVLGVNQEGFKQIFQVIPGVEITESTLEISALDRTGFRGEGCERTCKGYDIELNDMSTVCNGHGTCDLAGECACQVGYIGPDCEFRCPGFTDDDTSVCNGHGNCQMASLTRIDEELYHNSTECVISPDELQCISYAEINNMNFEYDYTISIGEYETLTRFSLGETRCVGKIYGDIDGNIEFNDGSIVSITGSDVTFPRVCATKYTLDSGNIQYGYIPDNSECYIDNNNVFWGENSVDKTKICMTEISKQSDSKVQGSLSRALKDHNCGLNKYMDVYTNICKDITEKPRINVTFYDNLNTHYEQKDTIMCIVNSKTDIDCVVCECLQDSAIGFWGNLFCNGCNKGYGNRQCSEECPGGVQDMCYNNGVCLYGTDIEKDLFQISNCICGTEPLSSPTGGQCFINMVSYKEVIIETRTPTPEQNLTIDITDIFPDYNGSDITTLPPGYIYNYEIKKNEIPGSDGSLQNYNYYQIIPGSSYTELTDAVINCCSLDNSQLLPINGYCLGIYQESSVSNYILIMGYLEHTPNQYFKIWLKEHEPKIVSKYNLKRTENFQGIVDYTIQTCQTDEYISALGVDTCYHYDDECNTCADGFTGKDCTVKCQKCLLGGECTEIPNDQKVATCDCSGAGQEGIWEYNCCPTGFRVSNTRLWNAQDQSIVNRVKVKSADNYDPQTTNELDAGYWCNACPGVTESDWLDPQAFYKICLNKGTCSIDPKNSKLRCSCEGGYGGEACGCDDTSNVPFVHPNIPYGCVGGSNCLSEGDEITLYTTIFDGYYWDKPHCNKYYGGTGYDCYSGLNYASYGDKTNEEIAWSDLNTDLYYSDFILSKMKLANKYGDKSMDFPCSDIYDYAGYGLPNDVKQVDSTCFWDVQGIFTNNYNMLDSAFVYDKRFIDTEFQYPRQPFGGTVPFEIRGEWNSDPPYKQHVYNDWYQYVGYVGFKNTTLANGFGPVFGRDNINYVEMALLHYEDYNVTEEKNFKLQTSDIVVKERETKSRTYGVGLDYTYELLGESKKCTTIKNTFSLPGSFSYEESRDHCARMCTLTQDCEYFQVSANECQFVSCDNIPVAEAASTTLIGTGKTCDHYDRGYTPEQLISWDNWDADYADYLTIESLGSQGYLSGDDAFLWCIDLCLQDSECVWVEMSTSKQQCAKVYCPSTTFNSDGELNLVDKPGYDLYSIDNRHSKIGRSFAWNIGSDWGLVNLTYPPTEYCPVLHESHTTPLSVTTTFNAPFDVQCMGFGDTIPTYSSVDYYNETYAYPVNMVFLRCMGEDEGGYNADGNRYELPMTPDTGKATMPSSNTYIIGDIRRNICYRACLQDPNCKYFSFIQNYNDPSDHKCYREPCVEPFLKHTMRTTLGDDDVTATSTFKIIEEAWNFPEDSLESDAEWDVYKMKSEPSHSNTCIEQIPCHLGEGPCVSDLDCAGDLQCISGFKPGFDLKNFDLTFKYCAPSDGYEHPVCSPSDEFIAPPISHLNRGEITRFHDACIGTIPTFIRHGYCNDYVAKELGGFLQMGTSTEADCMHNYYTGTTTSGLEAQCGIECTARGYDKHKTYNYNGCQECWCGMKNCDINIAEFRLTYQLDSNNIVNPDTSIWHTYRPCKEHHVTTIDLPSGTSTTCSDRCILQGYDGQRSIYNGETCWCGNNALFDKDMCEGEGYSWSTDSDYSVYEIPTGEVCDEESHNTNPLPPHTKSYQQKLFFGNSDFDIVPYKMGRMAFIDGEYKHETTKGHYVPIILDGDGKFIISDREYKCPKGTFEVPGSYATTMNEYTCGEIDGRCNSQCHTGDYKDQLVCPQTEYHCCGGLQSFPFRYYHGSRCVLCPAGYYNDQSGLAIGNEFWEGPGSHFGDSQSYSGESPYRYGVPNWKNPCTRCPDNKVSVPGSTSIHDCMDIGSDMHKPSWYYGMFGHISSMFPLGNLNPDNYIVPSRRDLTCQVGSSCQVNLPSNYETDWRMGQPTHQLKWDNKQCNGNHIIVFSGYGDNSGNDKVEQCLNACLNKNTPIDLSEVSSTEYWNPKHLMSWDRFILKGFFVDTAGRCGCSDSDSRSCTTSEPNNNPDRYDLTWNTQCYPGEYLSFSYGECRTCKAGKYQDSYGFGAECTTCDRGKYTPDDGMNYCLACGGVKREGFPSCDCAKGKYHLETATNGCEECAPGFYSDEYGLESCKTCEAGKTSGSGAVTCT